MFFSPPGVRARFARKRARIGRLTEDRHDSVEGEVLPPAAGALERYPEAEGWFW
jgi:hypothetical protein